MSFFIYKEEANMYNDFKKNYMIKNATIIKERNIR